MPRAIFLSLLLTASIAFAGRGNDLVHGELFTDVAHPQPGSTFHLGVLFDIAPGWHIYWKNPGDSGLATRLAVHLPPGYTAGTVQYPLPTKLSLPGDIVNYAYEHQTMLLVPVTVARDAGPGTGPLSVDVSWLVCQDVCLPGKSKLSIDLGGAPARPELFALWRSQLPVIGDPHVLGVSLNADSSFVTAKVSWNGAAPTDIQFFPASPDVDTASILCETKGETTTIHYKAALSAAKSGPLSTDGLIEFTVAGGKRIGINLYASP